MNNFSIGALNENEDEESLFKYSEKLKYKYRGLNDIWKRYRIKNDDVLMIVQDVNLNFLQDIRELDRKFTDEVTRIFLLPGGDKSKISFLLTELSEAVEENIELYIEKEDEFSKLDFHGLYERRSSGIKRSMESEWETARINQLQEMLNKTVFYQEDWFKLVYEHSLIVQKFINRYANDIQQHTVENERLNHKQQILLLSELGFFELDSLKNLSALKMGVLLSHLLNRNEKNCNTYFRERFNKDGVKSSKNIIEIEKLLRSLNLKS